MGLFSDVLLTVDYDRTLTDFHAAIPQRNLEAIHYFMDNGGAFTVNTGRSLPHSVSILEKVPMNAPFLVGNGSIMLENGVPTNLRTIDLPPEQTLRAVCEAFPDLNVELHGLTDYVGFQARGCWEEYCAANRIRYRMAQPGMELGPLISFDVYGPLHSTAVGQMFTGTPEEIARIDEAEAWLRDKYGDRIAVIRSQTRLLNIHAPGVSKLRSARDLQKKLGKKILVCVGDAENDLTMLEGADYAFCPSDGIVADRFLNVCPCGEGAVADVIYNEIPRILKG